MLLTKVILNIIFLFIISSTAFSQKYPEMVKVKGGTFLMGDLRKDFTSYTPELMGTKSGRTLRAEIDSSFFKNDGKLGKVTVVDFLISKQPISVEQYKAYCYSMGFDMPELPKTLKETYPMVNISFEDAESYCRWLSRKTNKKYRLSMEAEWEYAAKGANLNRPKGQEEQPEVSYKETPVDNDAIIKGNGLVWEWVLDVYGDKDWAKYTPRHKRVVRRGATGKKSASEQLYDRKGIFQDSTTVDIGFRVVESLSQPKRPKKKHATPRVWSS